MLEHVLGRPSTKSRRLQVLAVLSFWSFYLYKGQKHGPPGTQWLSRVFSKRLTTWQTVVITMLYLYASRNFSTLIGLASAEPMANMYDTTYYRATWVLTALDAGFWTAMKIRNKWLRDIASIVFSLFYLISAERADEKVRKVRGMLTVDHLRVAWNKGTTPYLSFLQGLMRPRFTRWPPRQIRIPRPANSDYTDPVSGWLYYDGPLADLQHHNKIILDIPGGGFVAMDPRCNDDKLFAWASKSGLPILSLDYKKAPEFPYPYALNECVDVYTTIIKTRGRCLGMSGNKEPRIVITGDSAGGNLTVSATLKILETSCGPHRRSSADSLPPPDGVVCFYPALDMNIGNWMSDEQMSLIRDRKARKTNRPIVRRKSMQYNALVGTPHHSDDEDESPAAKDLLLNGKSANGDEPAKLDSCRPEFSHVGPQVLSQAPSPEIKKTDSISHHPEPMKTRLATSSMISYFNDRVLTPEMMRAMIILYIGAHNRPDFSQDYFLSPVLAPEYLLAKFPKTYFMTGERDPLVDDTVIFAGRLRRAKEAVANGSLSTASLDGSEETDAAEVVLIPGISHGFMQFPGIYPPAWKHFERSVGWFEQLFADAEATRRRQAARDAATSQSHETVHRHRRQSTVGESSGDEDKPLEMSMTRATRGRTASKDDKTVESASPPTNADHAGVKGPKKIKKTLNKNKSLIKLKSTDDLLGRRMQGLASGLTGTGEED